MPNKNKTKGKTWEREVAKYLSNCYNKSFTRVPDSGAYTGGQNSHRREFLSETQIRSRKGDIVPPDDWKHFNAECKSYAEFPFHAFLIEQRIPLLEKWLEQTITSAEQGDYSIVFIKINRKGKFLAITPYQDFTTSRHILYTDSHNNEWLITGFEDFFLKNGIILENLCIGK